MDSRAIVLILLVVAAGCNFGSSAAKEGHSAGGASQPEQQAGTKAKPDVATEPPKTPEADPRRPPKVEDRSSVGMPLDIEIEVPEVPPEIQRPSPPLAEDGLPKVD